MLLLSSFSDPRAKDILLQGEVLALPTETVYGVGVRFDDENAYQRLCQCKGRSPSKPIAVRCGPDFPLDDYFLLTPAIKRVRKKFLPGPLTVLVKAKESAPYQTHLGTFVAGIRIPGKKELLDFLSSLPFALQVTSANRSGSPALKDRKNVIEVFKDSPLVKAIVEGKCESGTPTTVVSLVGDSPLIIRQGDVKKEEINRAFFGQGD